MARLAQLKQLHTNGDITKDEYDVRRKQVLDEMMNGSKPAPPANDISPRTANPSRLVGRDVGHGMPQEEDKPEESDSDEQQYIQDFHKDVYKNGREGEAMDKNATMTMNPSGVDGIYYTGKAPVVVDVLEEQLPDRKIGPEHKFRVVKTRMKKELLDTGVVRVTRTEKEYDGYTGAYLTETVQQKMKPKLSFHSTEAWDDDKDFDLTPGSSKVDADNVAVWHENFTEEEDKEYQRVMAEGVQGTEYQTRNINNNAGKNDFGWDGVHRYPGGKPETTKKPSKFRNIFAKKTAPKKDPNDQWAGFQDDWGDEDDPMKQRVVDPSKPAYKDGGKKGIFNVKKAGPKRDKNMGENPADYKLRDPTKKEGEREYLWDDGRGAGGFASGEQWGAEAKQHQGKHYAGGPHFTHQDMWK